MTEPIEYKKFDKKFSDLRDSWGVAVVGYPATKDDIKSFLKSNFIPKSEIKEAIERVEKSSLDDTSATISEKDLKRGLGFLKFGGDARGAFKVGFLEALSDLKSTLKLDNNQR